MTLILPPFLTVTVHILHVRSVLGEAEFRSVSVLQNIYWTSVGGGGSGLDDL